MNDRPSSHAPDRACADSPPAEQSSVHPNLTPRELEVLQHLAKGLSNKEIAHLLVISVHTVNRHADNLMTKLDIHNRVGLALYAIREGLAEPAVP